MIVTQTIFPNRGIRKQIRHSNLLETYLVTVICWDGIIYQRETTLKEIGEVTSKGQLKFIGNELTFDFRLN